MAQIVIMLKKFKHLNAFFHPEVNRLNMLFSPFVTTIGSERFQIMQACDNDIPALLELEKQVYSGQTPWDSFSFKTELRKKSNSLYLVVYSASTLVAFIGARFYPRETHITNVAVNPQYQGRHIGRRLLEMIIERARKNKSELVSLEVRIDNDRAKNLYQSLGFEAAFIRKNYYQDVHKDAVNMILWITPHKIKRRKFTF